MNYVLVCTGVLYFERFCMISQKFYHNICCMKLRFGTWYNMHFIPGRNDELLIIDCWYHTPHSFVNINSLVSRRRSCTTGSYFRSSSIHYGRPWPAIYINFVQNIHQTQVLTEPLCRAQAIFMRCRTTSAVPNIVG